MYEQALAVPGVLGIVVGTRPDCVDREKLDYFAQLARERYLVIEYGIESISDRTLKKVNRGHTFESARQALLDTAGRGIRAGGHMIIGLPGEMKEDWIKSAEVLSALPLHSIKFHQLQIIKGTAMEKEYITDPGRFHFFKMEEYLYLMTDILEKLNPSIVVERIAGEVNPDMSATEGWGLRYDRVLAGFEAILEERNTWQGRLFKKS
jgi:radical SAM protein (TIGR01212 family)